AAVGPSPPLLYSLSLHDALPISTTARCSLLRYKPDSSCTRGAVSLTCNLVPASGPNLQLVESWTSNSFLPTKDTGRHPWATRRRSEEHTSELQSRFDLVCRLLLA